MKIFETHAHYDDEKFDNDRKEIIKKIKEAGISRCINIGCDINTSIKSVQYSKENDFIYAAIGLHPSNLPKTKEEICTQIQELKQIAINNKKVVAIGEIGLDYYWNKDNKQLQKYAFIKQIELAQELNLPIIIHTRDAIDDTINIIRNNIKISGVLHCCPFNKELVKHGLEHGLYIAFGGTSTFKNAKNADEIINMVPLDKILVETDSPYLSPEPLRGKRNDSRNLKYIIKKLANTKKISEEKMAEITYNNAEKVFKT